jgi:hypothetical protein
MFAQGVTITSKDIIVTIALPFLMMATGPTHYRFITAHTMHRIPSTHIVELGSTDKRICTDDRASPIVTPI